jgi:hypothetical protein
LKLPLAARLRIAALAVFLTSLAAGTILYALGEEPGEEMGFENTNAYRHQLQRLGGKALVLYDRFDRWFESLWQGKTLGLTILVLGALASVGLVVFARLVSPPEDGD